MKAMLKRLVNNVDGWMLALLVIIPTTIVYWAALLVILSLGLLPVTAVGCLALALTLVLLDRGFSLFIKWSRDRTLGSAAFIAV